MTECSIRVICRFRPLNKREVEYGEHMQFLDFGVDKQSVVVSNGNKKEQFNYDRIFGGEEAIAAALGKEVKACTQEEVWREVGETGVREVTRGFTATIFAYGQTGAGKTFSMFGTDFVSENRGIIPRACNMVFDYILNDKDGTEFQVKCSFLEIYKEIVHDLLDTANVNLKVRETPQRGVWVEGLSERYVSSIQEVMDLLALGEKNRARASTNMNAQSSRSHSLFIITLIQKSKDGSEKIGKLNLADLAGSEKVGKTGATGNTLEEAKKINQSLSALGNCINALTSGAGKKNIHIPYRDSKLTHILKESLGGNSKTTLIIACSPHSSNVEETISTLRFGQRAKTIKNKVTAKIHRSVDELNAIILKLQTQLDSLRKYTKFLENKLLSLDSSINIPKLRLDMKEGSADKMEGESGNEGQEEEGNRITRNSTDYIIPSPSPATTLSSLLEDKDRGPSSSPESSSSDEFNPLLQAELQIELDKVKEQSQFTISNLEDAIKELKEKNTQKEVEIECLKQQMEGITKNQIENLSQYKTKLAEETKQRQILEKLVYEKSMELEKLKQRIDRGMDEETENKMKKLENQTKTQENQISELRLNIKKLEQENQLQREIASTFHNNTIISESNLQQKISDEKKKLQESENQQFSSIIDDFSAKLKEKTSQISALESEILQLKQIEAKQAEELEMNKRNPINYQSEQQITRLEIELEGKDRLLSIQDTRCKQLQTLTDEQTHELERLNQEKTNLESANAIKLAELEELRRKVELFESEAEKRKMPEVKIVKPISQPRTFSTYIGNMRRRELLPKRYSIKLAIKEGYLFKQGGIVRNWKRRWFVLKNSPPTLYYYEKDGASDPKGSIPLAGCVLQIADQETKRSNTFAVYHQTERTFYLQASSASDLKDWMGAIDRLLNAEGSVASLLDARIKVQ